MNNTLLEANGLRFQMIEEGLRDGELVLFLHGFPQFADAWLPLMRPVAGAGFHAVAVDQRGYSPETRLPQVEDYAIEHLVADVLSFADQLGAERVHLVGHDWGGVLAWQAAADHAERLRTLTVLSMPHTNAFVKALQTDFDQQKRSAYVAFFKLPGHVAEAFFAADNYRPLRRAYQNKVPEAAIERNVQRLSEPGALTAALNWYRALSMGQRTGEITVPTLYIWGSEDQALGETAALHTKDHVTGPYHFERLEGRSHWLMDEAPELIAPLLLDHLTVNTRAQ